MSRILIVGAGAMGSAAAFYLARQGFEVHLFDQFHPPHALGSSHGESRIIRKAYFEDPHYVPLLKKAYALWAELEESASSALFQKTGIVYYCPEESALLKGILASSQEHQIAVSELSPQELDSQKFSAIFRHPGDGYRCIFESDAGFLRVEDCIRAYLKLAALQKVNFHFGEEVLSWTSEQRSISIRTAKGEYTGEEIVFCSGAWTGKILAELNLPLRLLRKHLFWLQSPSPILQNKKTPCYFFEFPYGIFYGFPPLNGAGEIKVAEHSGGENFLDAKLMRKNSRDTDQEKILRFAREAFLSAEPPQILREEACMYTMSPDENFIVDRHPEHENVHIACGFSGHGFKFASVIGNILSELCARKRSQESIDFLSLKRFARNGLK